MRRTTSTAVLSLVLVVTLTACDVLDALGSLVTAIGEAGIGFDSEQGFSIGGIFFGGGRTSATFTTPDAAKIDSDEALTSVLTDTTAAATTYGLIGPIVEVSDFDKKMSTLFADEDLSSVSWDDVLADNDYGGNDYAVSLSQSGFATEILADTAPSLQDEESRAKEIVIDLPAKNGLPFAGPRQTSSVNSNRLWQNTTPACVAGGAIGFVFGVIAGKVPGAAAGAVGGCAGGVAGNAVYQVFYADQARIEYPVVGGVVSRDPKTWRVCTDYKVRPYDSNVLNPTGEFVQFRYPQDYPDKSIAGTTQPFARNCTPVGEGPSQ